MSQTPQGFFLSQHCYTRPLLEKAKMCDYKPIKTPIVASDTESEKVEEYSDASHYRMLVGSLPYSTITHQILLLQSILCVNLCTQTINSSFSNGEKHNAISKRDSTF